MSEQQPSIFLILELVFTWILIGGFALLLYWFVWYLIKTWFLIPLVKKNLRDAETTKDKTD